MIKKIKEMGQLAEKTDIVNKNLEVNIEKIDKMCAVVDSFVSRIENFDKRISDIENRNHDRTQKLDDAVSMIHDTHERLHKITNEITFIKTNFMDTVIEEMRKETKPHLARLKTDAKEFNQLNNHLSVINSELGTVKDEMVKFKGIARHIKETDFNLVNYKKKLDSEDRNKLNLMRENDNLRRLIAKERRKSR